MTQCALVRPCSSSVMFGVLLACCALPARAETFLVSPAGFDAVERNDRSAETAWKSLAYACERVPEGKHTIQLESGTFVATRAARPKSGVAIAGKGRRGSEATRIVASRDWPLSEKPCEGDSSGEHLIVLQKVEGITIRDLVLASEPEHRISARASSARRSPPSTSLGRT